MPRLPFATHCNLLQLSKCVNKFLGIQKFLSSLTATSSNTHFRFVSTFQHCTMQGTTTTRCPATVPVLFLATKFHREAKSQPSQNFTPTLRKRRTTIKAQAQPAQTTGKSNDLWKKIRCNVAASSDEIVMKSWQLAVQLSNSRLVSPSSRENNYFQCTWWPGKGNVMID